MVRLRSKPSTSLAEMKLADQGWRMLSGLRLEYTAKCEPALPAGENASSGALNERSLAFTKRRRFGWFGVRSTPLPILGCARLAGRHPESTEPCDR